MNQSEHDLCEIAQLTLRYRSKHGQPRSGKFGAYLGSGDGAVEGQQITGTIAWDLYEDQSDKVCDANLIGTIQTPDAAEIRFGMLGYFKREAKRPVWTLSSAIQFKTDDERYACFDDCVGVVRGSFDAGTYTHRYRVFATACGA